MDIRKSFLDSLSFASDMSGSIANKNNGKTSMGADFESHLENRKAPAKDDMNTTKEPFGSRKKDYGKLARAEADRQTPNSFGKKVTNINEAQKTSASNKTTNDSKVSNEQKASDEEKPVLTKEQEAQAIQALSEELNIPAELIADILNELSMSVLDLQKPENLTSFIMKLTGAEDQAQLLTIPDVSKTMKTISETLDNFVASSLEELAETQEASLVGVTTEDTTDADSKQVKEASAKTAADSLPVLETTTSKLQDQNTDIHSVSETAQNIETSQTAVESPKNDNSSSSQDSQSTNEQLLGENQLSNTTAKTEEAPIVFQSGETTFVEENGKVAIKSQPSAPVNTSNIIEQFADKLKVEFKPGMTELKINLRPDELGALTLKVNSENGVLTATFYAENQKVKELIESSFNDLRDMLHEQGLDVSKLSVSVGQEENEERMNQFLKEQEKSSKRVSQIIRNIAATEGMVVDNTNYVKPYEVSGSKVDFSA